MRARVCVYVCVRVRVFLMNFILLKYYAEYYHSLYVLSPNTICSDTEIRVL